MYQPGQLLDRQMFTNCNILRTKSDHLRVWGSDMRIILAMKKLNYSKLLLCTFYNTKLCTHPEKLTYVKPIRTVLKNTTRWIKGSRKLKLKWNLSPTLFIHLLQNYLYHFSCEQRSEKLWTSSRRDWVNTVRPYIKRHILYTVNLCTFPGLNILHIYWTNYTAFSF